MTVAETAMADLVAETAVVEADEAESAAAGRAARAAAEPAAQGWAARAVVGKGGLEAGSDWAEGAGWAAAAG